MTESGGFTSSLEQRNCREELEIRVNQGCSTLQILREPLEDTRLLSETLRHLAVSVRKC